MAVPLSLGPFKKGVIGLLERAVGLIQGRFRDDMNLYGCV